MFKLSSLRRSIVAETVKENSIETDDWGYICGGTVLSRQGARYGLIRLILFSSLQYVATSGNVKFETSRARVL